MRFAPRPLMSRGPSPVSEASVEHFRVELLAAPALAPRREHLSREREWVCVRERESEGVRERDDPPLSLTPLSIKTPFVQNCSTPQTLHFARCTRQDIVFCRAVRHLEAEQPEQNDKCRGSFWAHQTGKPGLFPAPKSLNLYHKASMST